MARDHRDRLAQDAERACEGLARLCALGVRIALDDFGTGFATLSQLHRFPAHALKIDRMFVDGMVRARVATPPSCDRSSPSVASSGMSVIAEGVETAAQSAALTRMGCTLFQGYHFARPAFAEPMPTWLRTGEPVGTWRTPPEAAQPAAASGTQLPWKPSGTRLGSSTRATGPSAGSAAGSTISSLRSVPASWTRRHQPTVVLGRALVARDHHPLAAGAAGAEVDAGSCRRSCRRCARGCPPKPLSISSRRIAEP